MSLFVIIRDGKQLDNVSLPGREEKCLPLPPQHIPFSSCIHQRLFGFFEYLQRIPETILPRFSSRWYNIREGKQKNHCSPE